MLKKLSERLDALEATTLQPVLDEVAENARQERLGLELGALMKRLDQEKTDYEALDAAGRIGHWIRKIEEAEQYISDYSEKPPPPPTGENRTQLMINIDKSFWLCELKSCKDNLESTYQFELAAARLDRLAELGYDQSRLKEWNIERRKWETLPWQWRSNYITLPADALALLQEKEAAAC